jgi:hypothetical protein
MDIINIPYKLPSPDPPSRFEEEVKGIPWNAPVVPPSSILNKERAKKRPYSQITVSEPAEPSDWGRPQAKRLRENDISDDASTPPTPPPSLKEESKEDHMSF